MAGSLASVRSRRWSQPVSGRQTKGGFRTAQFEVAFADDLPFQDDRFDAMVSRIGVVFVPSPVDAVREMPRVLIPGGKLALAVWHAQESNPFFYTLSRVMERYVDSPPLAPAAPDALRFFLKVPVEEVSTILRVRRQPVNLAVCVPSADAQSEHDLGHRRGYGRIDSCSDRVRYG